MGRGVMVGRQSGPEIGTWALISAAAQGETASFSRARASGIFSVLFRHSKRWVAGWPESGSNQPQPGDATHPALAAGSALYH